MPSALYRAGQRADAWPRDHADQLLVSRTDTKGRMTFANKAFADVSGFSGTELLGAPHNLTLLQRGDVGCRVPLPLVLITLRRVGLGVRTRHRRGAGWQITAASGVCSITALVTPVWSYAPSATKEARGSSIWPSKALTCEPSSTS
jgi:PAS domain-containing protein